MACSLEGFSFPCYPERKDDNERVSQLRGYKILDTPEEPRFDRVTELASKLFDAPIALVSLVDKDRQWFKAHTGLAARETPRREAFCNYVVADPSKPFVVNHADQDPRFKENPLVTGPPSIRFYASAPIMMDGNSGRAAGSLCVISDKARQQPFSAEDGELLTTLAGMASDLMQERREAQLVLERQHNARIVALGHSLRNPLHMFRHSLDMLRSDTGVILSRLEDGGAVANGNGGGGGSSSCETTAELVENVGLSISGMEYAFDQLMDSCRNMSLVDETEMLAGGASLAQVNLKTVVRDIANWVRVNAADVKVSVDGGRSVKGASIEQVEETIEVDRTMLNNALDHMVSMALKSALVRNATDMDADHTDAESGLDGARSGTPWKKEGTTPTAPSTPKSASSLRAAAGGNGTGGCGSRRPRLRFSYEMGPDIAFVRLAGCGHSFSELSLQRCMRVAEKMGGSLLVTDGSEDDMAEGGAKEEGLLTLTLVIKGKTQRVDSSGATTLDEIIDNETNSRSSAQDGVSASPRPPRQHALNIQTHKSSSSVATGSVATSDTESDSGFDFAKLRVVCVDDEATNRRILTRLLVKMGCSADNLAVFSDGDEVKLAELPFEPDIFLLDIVMLRMNGDVLCRDLRKGGCSKPIIAVTGNSGSEATLTEVGFDKVVFKPFRNEVIERAIMRAVSQTRSLSPLAERPHIAAPVDAPVDAGCGKDARDQNPTPPGRDGAELAS